MSTLDQVLETALQLPDEQQEILVLLNRGMIVAGAGRERDAYTACR